MSNITTLILSGINPENKKLLNCIENSISRCMNTKKKLWKLKDCSSKSIGNKYFVGSIYLMAFNYFDYVEFINQLRIILSTFPKETYIQLWIKKEDDDRFKEVMV